MKITGRTVGDVAVLDLTGNIKSSADMEEFSAAIDAEIGRGRNRILLNFADIGFINSSGLGRLVLASKKASEKKGAIKVVNLAPDIDELFTFTRLREKIGVFKSEDEALRSFQ